MHYIRTRPPVLALPSPQGEEEFTITMKPNGRSEMQSWLGILKEQVTIHANRKGEGSAGSLTVEQAGWMKVSLKEKALDRKFVVLVTEQKEVAEAMTVTRPHAPPAFYA